MSAAISGVSARERLLAAANELFYAEGHHTVGIDRVIARAGVAKASLYSTFGSKEELVKAYLETRAESRQKRIEARIAEVSDPREKIYAIFELLGEMVASPTYRGCAFVRASAEGPLDEGKVGSVCLGTRAWMRELLVTLAADANALNPELLGNQLAVVYDGAMVGASMERGGTAVRDAKATVAMLLDVGLRSSDGSNAERRKPKAQHRRR